MGVLAGAIAIALLVTTKPWVAVTEIRGKTDTLDYVRIYGWIAGAINVVLLACLAILCPWWAKPRDLTPDTLASVERSADTSMVLAFGDRRYGNNLLLQPAADDARVLG